MMDSILSAATQPPGRLVVLRFWLIADGRSMRRSIVAVNIRRVSGPAQVCNFFEAALTAGRLCLPKLTTLVLYVDTEIKWLDFFPEPEELACEALGKLVEAGVLPALAQAMPSPPCGSPLLSSTYAFGELQPAQFFLCAAVSPQVCACRRLCCTIRCTHAGAQTRSGSAHNAGSPLVSRCLPGSPEKSATMATAASNVPCASPSPGAL